MTAQITDTVVYRGEEHSLIGLEPPIIFHPLQVGLDPAMIDTACYRGYYCTYAIEDDRLSMTELTLREREGNYPSLSPVPPVPDRSGAHCYKGLHWEMDYTGALRLARGFLREFYIHMGYQKASAFETVLDLRLKAGRVAAIRDRSAEAASKRGAFKRHFEENVARGIDESFDLDMEIW
jgi:hypothetical protein